MGRKKQRMQQLEHTATLIQKQWGPRAIRTAEKKEATVESTVLPTGFANVDRALGVGGFPRGRISELIASGTAGQITLVAKTICQAQSNGQQVVYIDVDHMLDLDFIARCGVCFDSLVILRPFSFQNALEMAGDLVRDGGADVIVFDRIHPMLVEADLSRLDMAIREWNPALSRSLCTLLFLTETIFLDTYPVNLSLPYFASVRLGFELNSWLHQRHHVSGFVSTITVLKNKLGPPGRSVRIKVTFNGRVHGVGDA